MKNLGTKFKDAREARNISLRDAADMTKIRVDVLQNIENGSFDFDLPEVYKRGFIRLYAQFLKLDQSSISAEYAKLSGTSFRKEITKGLKGKTAADIDEEPIDTASRYDEGADSLPDGSLSTGSSDAQEESIFGSQYVKIAAIILALVVAVGLLVTIFSGGSADTNVNPDLQASQNADKALASAQPVADAPFTPKPSSGNGATVASFASQPSEGARCFTITATHDTHVVIYPAGNAEKPVISGLLEKNAVRTFFLKENPVLNLVDTQYIKLEVDGKPVNFGSATGPRKFEIKAN